MVMSNLMSRLGHNKYYVQGGDWGSIIGSNMATLFPDEVLGYHSNMPMVNTPLSNLKMILGSFCPSLCMEKQFINRVYPMKNRFMKLLEESGYLHIQATKPDTLGCIYLNTNESFLCDRYASQKIAYRSSSHESRS